MTTSPLPGAGTRLGGRPPGRSRPRRLRRSVGLRLRMALRSATTRLSSSLTRRIVVLNLGGLVALLVLFLYINQFREGLIDARVQSLQTQGEIIAAAIAASASVDDANITVDPEKLLQATPGQPPNADEDAAAFEFSINPDRVGPVLRRLVTPTGTRARIFDSNGVRVVDTRAMALPGARSKALPASDLPWLERAWLDLRRRLGKPEAALDEGRNGDAELPEVAEALGGHTRWIVRVNARGQTIVSMAVPIVNANKVQGALLLSTQPGDVDKIIASDRWALFRVFLVAAVVMFVLSLFLANTIAGPIRRLAEAAERVRRGVDSREEIPDFTARADEIGHLSRALRDMTRALYSRMEATESFAADVAHELKNPLTSLRSAVETLPRIKAEESRGRLTAIIQHDIKRLDRLISDISDASRLDAELARNRTAGLDVAALVRTVVSVANEVERGDGVRFALTVALPPPGQDGPGYRVMGHDSRLGQVINNLLDNARSFSEEDGTVRVSVRPARLDEEGRAGVEVIVDDDGPGIPAHAFERIFERFYTDRPDQGFGQNSGLGLSISRQIIEAHGGRIWAANRVAPAAEDGESEPGEPRVFGARFTVWLPAVGARG
ncbi:stimulus-sensing domain-containing protein [Lichenibacterium dinghuense]|uniref:stimulus-sensing domain-containing protein n=1 Tax=Lichenibacterium dinghuense TaxID=2895977 RepID=UPI001F2C6095|nr:stimulus-sensing domain-containing protein [Lichenibacterium sp. 6Y81]